MSDVEPPAFDIWFLDVVKSRVKRSDKPLRGVWYITDELAAITREGGLQVTLSSVLILMH